MANSVEHGAAGPGPHSQLLKLELAVTPRPVRPPLGVVIQVLLGLTEPPAVRKLSETRLFRCERSQTESRQVGLSS